jgi:hypothetical protein
MARESILYGAVYSIEPLDALDWRQIAIKHVIDSIRYKFPIKIDSNTGTQQVFCFFH